MVRVESIVERKHSELPRFVCVPADVDAGDRVTVELRRASEELPAELAELLEREPAGRAAWMRLSPARRRQLAEHVRGGKREETRTRRAKRLLEALLSGG